MAAIKAAIGVVGILRAVSGRDAGFLMERTGAADRIGAFYLCGGQMLCGVQRALGDARCQQDVLGVTHLGSTRGQRRIQAGVATADKKIRTGGAGEAGTGYEKADRKQPLTYTQHSDFPTTKGRPTVVRCYCSEVKSLRLCAQYANGFANRDLGAAGRHRCADECVPALTSASATRRII